MTRTKGDTGSEASRPCGTTSGGQAQSFNPAQVRDALGNGGNVDRPHALHDRYVLGIRHECVAY